MAVEADLSADWQLMSELLAEGRAGVLSLGSPADSSSTEDCGEWKAGPSGPHWAQTGEAVVRHNGGCSRRVLLLIEPQLYMSVLTCCFHSKTHRWHPHSEMRHLT